MEIGKVPNSILKEIIIDKLKNKRKEVIVRPNIGEDCCAVDFGEYICVMSSDPITGTVNEIGRLAVNISCNDIASSGVEPIGLLVTILAPPGTTEKELEVIMNQLSETASELNVDIMGGHTEITDSVTRFVLNTTAIGKTLKNRFVKTGGAKPGDKIILTKSAGMEGTAIIAFDNESELISKFGKALVEEAKGFINEISVVKEGLISGAYGVSAMHDVTEGGVLGAVWELCEASGTGVEIYEGHIPIALPTSKICEYYNISPLKLISSGCMLIACRDGEDLVKRLLEENISAAAIGIITEKLDKLLINENGSEQILPPESDELYKVRDTR